MPTAQDYVQMACNLISAIWSPIWPFIVACVWKPRANANTTDIENTTSDQIKLDDAFRDIQDIKNSVEEIRQFLQRQPQEGQDQDQGQQNQED